MNGMSFSAVRTVQYRGGVRTTKNEEHVHILLCDGNSGFYDADDGDCDIGDIFVNELALVDTVVLEGPVSEKFSSFFLRV